MSGIALIGIASLCIISTINSQYSKIKIKNNDILE
jgi:hypothetical protein